MPYYVYILTNKPNGTLYIGITNNLLRRIYEHKEGLIESFSKKHELKMLAHFEIYDEVNLALQREKNLKHWLRTWKIQLINQHNPDWKDLSKDLFGY